jgi:hypothetical protein
MDEHTSPNPSRIILAIETRLLREMLKRVICHSPEHKLVCEVTNGPDLSELVKRQDVQWIITSLSPQEDLSDSVDHLLAVLPRVSIMALAPDGSEVRVGWSEIHEEIINQADNRDPIVLRWTEPHQESLTDPSLPELLELLRTDMGRNIQFGNRGALEDVSVGR